MTVVTVVTVMPTMPTRPARTALTALAALAVLFAFGCADVDFGHGSALALLGYESEPISANLRL